MVSQYANVHDSQQSIQRLQEVRRAGYRYLRTDDDGETWTGTHDGGIELDFLLESRAFRGKVALPEPCNESAAEPSIQG